MAKSQKMQKKPAEKPAQLFQPKDFLDRIAPAAVKFNTDSYVLGGLYRCVLALRGYLTVVLAFQPFKCSVCHESTSFLFSICRRLHIIKNTNRRDCKLGIVRKARKLLS